MEQWNGKVAIVTGASAGIGEAIAKALVKHGVHVIALARREEKLKELAKDLKSSKGSLRPLQCDVRKEEDILKAFQYAESEFGGVDILVNNAGITCSESITDGKTETSRAILEVNVLAPAIATREAVRSMRKRGTNGHIVNINSLVSRNAVLVPFPMSIYPASKYALDAMTANVRQEIKANKDRIKVTAIRPGFVNTEVGAIESLASLVRQEPHVEPEDVANSVVFALSAAGNVQIDEITITAIHGY